MISYLFHSSSGYCLIDSFSTEPDLFYNSLINEQTAACGTIKQREGVPKELSPAKFKQQGKYKVVSHNRKMTGMRLLGGKHVTLVSTAYGTRKVNNGRKHWQTKQPLSKPEIHHIYNKFTNGLERNGHFLKYLKKKFSCLINIAMVKSYIMYKLGLSTRLSTKNTHFTHTDFFNNVIKAMIAEAVNDFVPPTTPTNSSTLIGYDVQQL